MGRLGEAVQCYDVALQCDPLDAECLYNKGLALKKLGKAEEAASCMNSSVRSAMGA